jgi:hypothetical protein
MTVGISMEITLNNDNARPSQVSSGFTGMPRESPAGGWRR